MSREENQLGRELKDKIAKGMLECDRCKLPFKLGDMVLEKFPYDNICRFCCDQLAKIQVDIPPENPPFVSCLQSGDSEYAFKLTVKAPNEGWICHCPSCATSNAAILELVLRFAAENFLQKSQCFNHCTVEMSRVSVTTRREVKP